MGIDHTAFERKLTALRTERGVDYDTELTADDLRGLVRQYKDLVEEQTGGPFPSDPEEQLWGAVKAVFRSWDNERAVAFRRHHRIPDDMGTAVTVQTMVYGNMGDDSGTGVAFTRNPSTGERVVFGEFLLNAQGEDVVSGIRTPLSISEMETLMPEAYRELYDIQEKLEHHYLDMQDLEFTVERGRLYLLQTRTGKRTAAAAIKIAVEMVDEGLIPREEAVLRLDADQLEQQLHPGLDPDAETQELATGLPASPGAASGITVFDPDEAVERSQKGEAVILVRRGDVP